MSGTNQSKVTVTLRNPLDHNDLLEYYIIPDESKIGQDWIIALKHTLQTRNLLEKNFCFLGFPQTTRTLDYLCDQLNIAVEQINNFNATGSWQSAGLQTYIIEDWYHPNSVRFPDTYPLISGQSADEYIGEFENYYRELGLSLKHHTMNTLHNYFEQLQGTVWNLSDYYKIADYETKYAIRQLNILCHEIENLVLSCRKEKTAPNWIRPSQITTFLHAERHTLLDEHREGFATNGYDRKFGHVYMHWTQIGKTLFEVFRDEGAPTLNIGDDPTDISIGAGTTCEAINSLKYYSGEFDIEWGASIYYNNEGKFPWHTEQIDEFNKWLTTNKVDSKNPALSLGYLSIGHVDLLASFGTTNQTDIWNILSKHLNIYKIEIDGVSNTYDYCWTDVNYKHQQIDMMRPGYDFSSLR